MHAPWDVCSIAQRIILRAHAAVRRQVVVTDATLAAMEAARAAGRPLWRVSSTVFTHVRYFQHLESQY